MDVVGSPCRFRADLVPVVLLIRRSASDVGAGSSSCCGVVRFGDGESAAVCGRLLAPVRAESWSASLADSVR